MKHLIWKYRFAMYLVQYGALFDDGWDAAENWVNADLPLGVPETAALVERVFMLGPDLADSLIINFERP